MKKLMKVLCATFAALVCAGCGATREEPVTPSALLSTTTAAVPAPAEKQTVAPKTPEASGDLLKACRALGGVKSFRALMTTTGSTVMTETRTEAALPGRFHVFNADYELVIIGSEVYRKLPGGNWQTSPTGLAVTSLIDPKKLEEYLKTAQVTLAGTETLEGTQVRVYQAEAARSPARKSVHDDPDPFHMKIWVGMPDGLPRRLEGTVLSTKTKTAVTYYDFNAKLAVKKPIVPK
jgi:hypothetical protein